MIMILLALILALLSAASLAVGTHLQHRGVVSSGAGTPSLRSLRSPVWICGTVLIGAATLGNVAALGLAPVALVQPVGAVSLVLAVIISVRTLRVRVTPVMVVAVALTVVGVGVFVGSSASAVRAVAPRANAMDGLIALLCCLGLLTLLLSTRPATGHLPRVLLSGLLYGCVASSVHVLLVVLGSGQALTWRWWVLAGVMAGAVGTGMWLVQTAYASGPPETVLAGLTVIDPLTAVGLSAVLLHEYAVPGTLSMLVMVTGGVAALVGVLLLARSHPGLRAGRMAEPAEPTDPADSADSAELVGPAEPTDPHPSPDSPRTPTPPLILHPLGSGTSHGRG